MYIQISIINYEKLMLERNISFDEISQMIIDGKYHRKYKGEIDEN